MGIAVLEEYFDRFYRVIRVDSPGGDRLYSIDYYVRLSKAPRSCSEVLALDSVQLCYAKLNLCEALILIYENRRIELISLRLKTRTDSDPVDGSLSKARALCVEEAQRLVEAMRSSLGREG
ncbi:MAG: hypothetical protein QXS85_03555 [Acidilobaceae archaeon]